MNYRQKWCTFTSSGNACVSTQSFVLSNCASASSCFPANSGLKCDQFNCGMCWIGCAETGGSTYPCSCTGGWGACGTYGACGAGGAWGTGGTGSVCHV